MVPCADTAHRGVPVRYERGVWVELAGRGSAYLSRLLNNLAFPGGSKGKVSACNAGDLGSIPG